MFNYQVIKSFSAKLIVCKVKSFSAKLIFLVSEYVTFVGPELVHVVTCLFCDYQKLFSENDNSYQKLFGEIDKHTSNNNGSLIACSCS